MIDDEVLRSRERVVERRANSSGERVSGEELADRGRAAAAAPTAVRARLAELLAHAPEPALTPHVIDGPFWYDVDLVRDDLREDRPGIRLDLALRVVRVADDGRRVPVPGAVVEVWHADAGGIYSGFEAQSQTPIPMTPEGLPVGPPPPPSGGISDGGYSHGSAQGETSDDGTYLRGAQPADAEGVAYFTTIYPGWYVSRSVHVHVKVHIDRVNALTAQLFFDDALNDDVFGTVWPYDQHTGRDTRNERDFLYNAPSQFAAVREGDQVFAAMNLVIGDYSAEREPILILNRPA